MKPVTVVMAPPWLLLQAKEHMERAMMTVLQFTEAERNFVQVLRAFCQRSYDARPRRAVFLPHEGHVSRASCRAVCFAALALSHDSIAPQERRTESSVAWLTNWLPSIPTT